MNNIGSKSSVYKGNSYQTAGGLLKRDIGRKTDRYGNVKYYSKHQAKVAKKNLNRTGWPQATKKARRTLYNSGEIGDGFIPVLKSARKGRRGRGGRAMSMKVQRDGVKIYKLAKQIIDDETPRRRRSRRR